MKNLYTLFFLGVAGIFQAQVGIGTTTPNSSALLDVTSTNKGVLLPKVALKAINDNQTIANPALSLMTYNTTTANSGNLLIEGNRIYTWDSSKWGTFTYLTEIRNLKKPIDFARVSKVSQDFDAQERNTINNGGIIPIQWLATDVVIANTTDITAPDGTDITIKTASFYQLSGSFSVTIRTPSSAATNFVLTLQKQIGGTGAWTNVVASSRPIEQEATEKIMSILFPNIVHKFGANDKIRFVISRPIPTSTPAVPTANYIKGTAINTRLAADIKKSIRITRLAE